MRAREERLDRESKGMVGARALWQHEREQSLIKRQRKREKKALRQRWIRGMFVCTSLSFVYMRTHSYIYHSVSIFLSFPFLISNKSYSINAHSLLSMYA
jgi:hypothetical protein